jgi:succinate dehydrogenase hydrophobic anchor subunit
MEHMSSVVKWWSRATAALIGAVLTLVIPVHAWAASNGVADVATEAAKYRSRSRGFGFFGFAAVCCLAVVALIVLIVFLIVRGRRRK